MTAYLDVHNLFNFTNVLRVFPATGTTVNPADRQSPLGGRQHLVRRGCAGVGAVRGGRSDRARIQRPGRVGLRRLGDRQHVARPHPTACT